MTALGGLWDGWEGCDRFLVNAAQLPTYKLYCWFCVKVMLEKNTKKTNRSPMTAVISQHIEITPGVCGGRPRIAGHRIRVQDVAVWHEQMGMSPDEIVSRYPNITLSDVYAALAYYHDHFQEIREHIRDDEELVREMQAEIPSKMPRNN